MMEVYFRSTTQLSPFCNFLGPCFTNLRSKRLPLAPESVPPSQALR